MYAVIGTKTSIGGRSGRLRAPAAARKFVLPATVFFFRDGRARGSSSPPSCSSSSSPRGVATRGGATCDSSSWIAGTYTSRSRPRDENSPSRDGDSSRERPATNASSSPRDDAFACSSSSACVLSEHASSSTAGGVSNPASVASASAAYASATTTKTRSNPRSGPNARCSPAYARGVTTLASPNAPMVKLSACAHRACPTARTRHTRMLTPIRGSVAPCTTASRLTCHSAEHSGVAPTLTARSNVPNANTACASYLSSIAPVGSANTPPLRPPIPRYAPSAALGFPTRRASSGMTGPRSEMNTPLLNEPHA